MKNILIILACMMGLCTNSSADFNSREFKATATFELDDHTLVTQSAFAKLTNEFFGGQTTAIAVYFFPKPLTESGQNDILTNDAKELTKDSHAILVFFVDKENKLWQVNMTYVIPGMTVARTVAWKTEELQKFSDFQFGQNRLKLKSKAGYTETEKEKTLKLTWDVDLNLPVFDLTSSARHLLSH